VLHPFGPPHRDSPGECGVDAQRRLRRYPFPGEPVNFRSTLLSCRASTRGATPLSFRMARPARGDPRGTRRGWADTPHSHYSWGIGLPRSLPTTTEVVGWRERHSSHVPCSAALNGAGFDPFNSPLTHTKASPEVIQRLFVLRS